MVIQTRPKTASKPAAAAPANKPVEKPKTVAKPNAQPDPKEPAKTKPARAKAKKAAKPKARKSASKKTVRPGTEKKSAQDRTGDRKLEIGAVVAALRKMGGLRTAAAQELGVARSTLYVFLAENQDAVDALLDIEEELKDIAESKLIQLIRAGDAQTVRWYLELKAKDRGYVRRVENTGPNGGPIDVREKPDLSKLSDKELEILAKLAGKRESADGAR